MSTPRLMETLVDRYCNRPVFARTREFTIAWLAIVMLIVGSDAALAECPYGQRMNTLVEIHRGSLPMHELWDMGADDFGIVGDRIQVRVSAQMLEQFTARGIAFEMLHENIDEAYQAYLRNRTVRRDEPFFDYHDYESATAVMDRLATEHSDIAAMETIGRSIEGRPIHALRISDNAATIEPDEPAILIDGCHHAREWIAVEVPLFYADYLVDNYRKVGAVTRLINYTELWIVPVLNPDGYVFTAEDRWWRKNRRDNGDGTFGVDPNRNYSIGWGDDNGSSGLTFSEVYRGPEPFSEPETQAVRDLMEGSFGRGFVTALSYHSYSQLVMYPNGYTTDPVENRAYYDELAAEMTRLINTSHNDPRHDYIFGPPSEILYIASGTSTDWAHHAIGATAFVLELRPAGPPFFELPPEEILPTCLENLPAFLYLAERTMIPDLRGLDADLDGFVDEDDYCVNSPGSAEVDAIGCASTEQDVDNDLVPNAADACRDSLPGQQVTAEGCRIPPLFTVDVSTNVESVRIDVVPADIDAFTTGDTAADGFRREYGTAGTVTLTATPISNGSRFDYWLVNGIQQPDGQRDLTLADSVDVQVEAVYVFPVRVDVVGGRRIPDKRSDGIGFIANYTARIVFSDDSTEPVVEVDEWSLSDENVAAVTARGELVAYDVNASTGETTTSLQASIDYGGRRLVSEPLRLIIFDQETRPAHCAAITLEGPDRVESSSTALYTAQVMLDGEPQPKARSDEVRWDVIQDGAAEANLPASVADGGELTARRVSADTPIVLRAAFINGNDTVCLATKMVTIGASTVTPSDDPAGRTSTGGTCGAGGMVALIAMFGGAAACRWVLGRR